MYSNSKKYCGMSLLLCIAKTFITCQANQTCAVHSKLQRRHKHLKHVMAISLGTKLLPLGSKFSIGTQFELTTQCLSFCLKGKKFRPLLPCTFNSGEN